MDETNEIFAIQRQGDTAIVTPQIDLREFAYEEIAESAQGVSNLLKDGEVRNLVFDFHKTEYYGSTALGFFVKLWTKVKSRRGQMAFCNISKHELEVLRITKLSTLWSICDTLEEALAAVKA